MSRGTVTISDVKAFIRKSVNSPDWLTNIQLELDRTTDPGRRQTLEDQLRRRREALAEYGEVRPTPLDTKDER